MQKISHFWAQMKKDPKCQLRRFVAEPFNYYYFTEGRLSFETLDTDVSMH